MFEWSPLPNWIRHRDSFAILAANERTKQLFGYSHDELLTMTIPDLHVPRNHERLMQNIEYSDSYGYRGEWTFKRKDGGEFNLEVWTHEIEYEGQPAVHVIGRDISERKLLEAERQRAQALEAKLAHERDLVVLKERFMSMVSHEFRTPLSVILSTADILRNYSDRMTPEQSLRRLDSIVEQVRHMEHLIDNILLLGRENTHQLEPRLALVNMVDLCANLVDSIRLSDHDQHEIVLTLDLPVGQIWSDAMLLRRIFTNLLSNATKYSPPKTRVAFAVKRSGSWLMCSVRDEGIGIPEEDQARLFEPFHRASNADHIHGTGLGMAIVRLCVDKLHGEIAVSSKLGGGTTFTVQLPLLMETNFTGV